MPSELSYPESAESFEIRRVTPDDGDILANIYENTPDTGEIGMAPRFNVDPIVAHTAAYPDTETPGFLAIAPDGSPAGAGFVNLTRVRAGGEVRPAAYLAGLAVHEEYRGQGLAKRLAAERIHHATSNHDEDAVIYASIQSGNEPSQAVAETWADDFPYQTRDTLLPPQPESTRSDDYTVRAARKSEYHTIETHVNVFYDRAELFRPYTPDLLKSRLNHCPIDDPVTEYLVATRDDELVAGAFVFDAHKLMWTKIETLPPELEDADELPPSIPESREVRVTSAIDLWFTDGHEDALDAILDTVRARSDSGNRIAVPAHPESPVSEAIDTDGVSKESHVAVRGIENPVEDAFLPAVR